MQLQSICSHWNALPKITANIYWNSPKNTVSWIKSVKCVYLFLLKFHWKKIRSWWHLVPTLQRTKIMPQKYLNVCFYSVRSLHVSLIFFSLSLNSRQHLFIHDSNHCVAIKTPKFKGWWRCEWMFFSRSKLDFLIWCTI